MIDKKIEAITREDLEYLVNNNILENRTLEYKREFHYSNDSEKKEFLADVSSFANSGMGDLIFGIGEDDENHLELCGIDTDEETVDEFKQSIENVIRDNIRPRIRVKIKSIELKNEKIALIIRIYNSFNGPHCVEFKKSRKFFTRNSNGKYQMDVDEIRQKFLLSDTLIDKIKNFKIDRLMKILSNETYYKMPDKPKVVLHIIPIQAFDISAEEVNLEELKKNYEIMFLTERGSSRRINFDGIIYYLKYDGEIKSYIQIYKKGIIEIVDADLLNNDPFNNGKSIPSTFLEQNAIGLIKFYIKLLESYRIQKPYFIFMSFLNIKDYKLAVEGGLSGHSIQENILQLNNVVYDEDTESIDKMLKPIFDDIWNAAGLLECLHYDENGDYKNR